MQTDQVASRTRPVGHDARRSRSTWYRPLEEQADIRHVARAVGHRPGRASLNTVGDIHLRTKGAQRGGARFERRPTDAEMSRRAEGHMTALFV